MNASGGEINAINDQLTFSQSVTNDAGGQINAINSTITLPGDGIPTSEGGDNSDGLINNGDLNLIGSTVEGDVHSPAGSNTFVGGLGVVFNGLVSGGGNFPGVGAVTFNGGYAPGDSPASVELGGDVNFGSGNTLFVELGGTTQGSFDQLLVSDEVSLSGSLEITTIDNFPPTLGDTFEIITATGGVTGEFDNVTLPGAGYELRYSPTAVTVIATSGLAGDYNNDGIVDAADYTVWRNALTAGATELLNDSTPGTVDESDFSYWRAHFGQSLGSGAGADENAAVPEPASALLLMLGIIAGIRIQRRIVSRVPLTR